MNAWRLDASSNLPNAAPARRLACGILTVAFAVAAPVANAQAPDPAPSSAVVAPEKPASIEDVLKQRAEELEAARTRQKEAAEAEQKLKAEIAVIGQDRNKLNQQLIDVAARMRGVETRMGEAEGRIGALDQREQMTQNSLDARRAETTEVLAALQRAGRRTPPALMTRPEDALKSLRTAMLLGAVVPEMRARAERLIEDLNTLVRVRTDLREERQRLNTDRDNMTADQQRLAALIDERQRRQEAVEKDMDTERQRAVTLSRQADDLRDLIAKMEQEIKAAAAAAAAANLKGAPTGKPNLNALKDPGRLSPAIAFASAKGLLTLPVNGTRIRTFGAADGAGGTERGISLTTRPGSQVTTPCDGWVVYSGPFRSYGQLLILNAGGGYHVLLAGMERISVNIGQFVLTGEPVGTMGKSSQVASIIASAPGLPVLYVEFRKDNAPIDPGPWWTASEGEKVRG